MEKVQQMLDADIRKKNVLMYVSFTISLVLALLKSLGAKEIETILLFSIELLLFTAAFIVSQKLLKKTILFPYVTSCS
ncbi:hypothetical protein GKZ89_15435 [Bacillus mangrovi]|uniref:Uncharacterized protein n=1 Tax=Metabacillus mangrovi TaxID=1491830 RepID=A0A7X2V628_9BACI|nr:hypothetical protein [Metabacillus mangrovi]MTH54796.1 hypothetical protein [Metabacillus mangrovi]